MKMVMNRNLVVKSTKGYVLNFVTNKPIHVPAMMVSEVMEKGGLPADGEKLPEVKEPKKEEIAPEGAKRVEVINEIFALMAEENNRESFNAAGVPKQKVVQELYGFEIDAPSIKEMWDSFKEENN